CLSNIMFRSLRQGSKQKRHSQPAAASSSASALSSASVAPNKRPLPPSQSQTSICSSLATNSPAETNLHPQNVLQNIGEGQNYGIHVLYDGSEACVDVVFVHGLTGNAYDTWLHKETGIHWPTDLLGQDISDIRVLSFGFDADIVRFFGRGSASNGRLTNHGESLVCTLVRERARSGTQTRKIIFVAHSLGGLVVEHALTSSKNSAESHLHQIELDTVGIVFLGVPHCGADLVSWARIGRRIVGLLRPTNKDILDVLDPNSEMLHLVENNFHTNLRQRKDNPIEITGFYEELAVEGVGEVRIQILLHLSQLIAQDRTPTFCEDRRDMTKFADRRDPAYDLIVGELQRWVISVRSAKQEALPAGVYKMSAEETTCLQSFCPSGIDYQSQKDQNPRRVADTCLWTLQNPKYLEWRDNDVKRLIWISADPGCGKSVLARCIIDEDLPNAFPTAPPKRILYYFFKDTSLEQRSVSRALCAVLHQLFTFYPRLIRHALQKYSERGAALSTTLPELWSIFIRATADPTAGKVICVFDALDESDEQERSTLIEYLEDFYLRQRTSPSTSHLKFLVTSRPYFNIRRGFDKLLEASSNIELAGNDESTSIQKEIDLVIEYKVLNLQRENRLMPEVANYLKKRLHGIEHRTYLWLHLLWKIIRDTLSGTKSEMDRLIDNLPNGIQESYEILLEKCPDRDFARRLLQIVLVAARPLTLEEVDVALHVNKQTLSYTELDREGTDRLRDTLPSRCGLMVSVVEDKVYFIHQTVKEFLLKKDSTRCSISRIWQQSLELKESHTVLAEACLRLLSFPEIRLSQTNLFTALLPEADREMEPNDYCRQFCFLSYTAIYWADHSRGPKNHEHAEIIQSLLQEGSQSSIMGKLFSNCGTVLQAASCGGHQDIVQVLLDKGADVNAQGRYYGNALHAASYEGYRDIIRILLDKGADVNAKGGEYGNALQVASYRGHQNIVQLLLDKGANVNAQGVQEKL
ncbi:MAG: hypothetical protein Q9214_004294, partial [Letrouitia sp. 1 TL-2023]